MTDIADFVEGLVVFAAGSVYFAGVEISSPDPSAAVLMLLWAAAGALGLAVAGIMKRRS
jgi:hypothetical protein